MFHSNTACTFLRRIRNLAKRNLTVDIGRAVCGIALTAGAAGALAAANFPNQIQTCMDAGQCSAALPIAASAYTSAFAYSDGTTAKFLLGYSLGSGSRDGDTVLGGTLWVGAQASYVLGDALHVFDLYFDRVTPTPSNLWIGDSDGLDVQLALTDDALLAGQGRLFFEDGGSSFATMATIGDGGTFSQIDNLPQSFVPCAANSCQVQATFNLTGYHYRSNGSTAQFELALDDGQTSPYTQLRDFTGFPSDFPRAQTYTVVPLPTSFTLLASVVTGFVMRVRRRKSSPL